MDTKLFEDYQKQVSDWQQKFFDVWLENLPIKGKNPLNFSENFEQALKFQEELVKSYLEAQEKTTQMMIEAQRQFWNDYFEVMRKNSAAAAN